MPYADPEKRRAYSARYYREHMDGTRTYNKNYRTAHWFDRCPHGRRQLERSCSLCAPRKVYQHYRSDEKRKFGSIPEDFMSWELFLRLIGENCVWCGRTPEEVRGMGIDRWNNDLPHLSTNVKPACTDCNMMRRSLTVEDFLSRVSRIAEFQRQQIGIGA